MFKTFTVNRDPNETDSGGIGMNENAQPAQSQDSQTPESSEGSNPDPSSSPKDEAYYDSLASRLMKDDPTLSDADTADLMEYQSVKHSNGKSDVETPIAEAKTDVETSVIPKSDEGDDLVQAMKLVGAKNVSELASKTKELRDFMNSKGGQDGQEKIRLANETAQLRDLLTRSLNGDQTAIAEANKITGRNPSVIPLQQDSLSESIKDAKSSLFTEDEINNAIDPEMMRKVNDQQKSSIARMEALERQNALLEGVHKQATMAKEVERATDQIVTDLVSLVERYPDQYKPKTGDLRKMINDYKEGVTDPRFDKVAKTFEYMVKNSCSLEMAHRFLSFEELSNPTQKILAAKRETRERLEGRPTTVQVAGRASGNDAIISQDDVNGWIKNDTIPAEFMTETGLNITHPKLRHLLGI
jgi:hypothetical protein